MIRVMPREPEQQMVNGKIMKMKKIINPKTIQKKYFAAAGGSGGGNDPFKLDNNKFNEFIKNLKKKKITEDIAKKLNEVCNNNKFQEFYKNINKIIKK